jgi:hypothetical protein
MAALCFLGEGNWAHQKAAADFTVDIVLWQPQVRVKKTMRPL